MDHVFYVFFVFQLQDCRKHTRGGTRIPTKIEPTYVKPKGPLCIPLDQAHGLFEVQHSIYSIKANASEMNELKNKKSTLARRAICFDLAHTLVGHVPSNRYT